ncbi:hypothetical protein RQP46_004637 [Phenoliferia psychrophenolica]
MVVYHIVIFKLAESATSQGISEFVASCRAMVGAVPGLISMEAGPCLPGTLHRSQGFDFGLCAILEKASDLPVYAAHDAHQPVMRQREALGVPGPSGVIAYDFEAGFN